MGFYMHVFKSTKHADALKIISKSKARKHFTMQEYYDEMVRRGTCTGFSIPKDPKYARFFKQAKDKYKKDYATEHVTLSDLIKYLENNSGSTEKLYNFVGNCESRKQMAKEAIMIYERNIKNI